jgi:carbon monoxide dehydrogenase subunit G
MKFENKFAVEAPPAEVWDALMDFERVVPCMPGAELLGHEGEDSYQVQVRVKVGPMSMTYKGTVEVTERDEQAHRAAMRVQARETRGQGTANATMQIELSGDGAATEASMDTDLRLSGRAATMGRGVISDVSQALISQFANNLQQLLSGPSSTAASPAGGAADGGATPESAAAPAAAAASAPGAAPASAPGAAPASAPGAAPAPPAPAPSAEKADPSSGKAVPGLKQPASFPEQALPSPEPATLDAVALARGVVANRLRDPRTAVLGMIASVLLGFLLGRSRRR